MSAMTDAIKAPRSVTSAMARGELAPWGTQVAVVPPPSDAIALTPVAIVT